MYADLRRVAGTPRAPIGRSVRVIDPWSSIGDPLVVEVPTTRFTYVGGDRLAYQVFGVGSVDLVYVVGDTDTVDMVWDWPASAHFLRRLASFARVIMFDRRGAGASDRATSPGLAIWEHWADDIRAVLDATDSERAAIYAASDSGPSAILFAATAPERTKALVLSCTTARFTVADDYPIGFALDSIEQVDAYLAQIWGTEEMASFASPTSAQDPAYRRFAAKMQRAAYSAHDLVVALRTGMAADARQVLSGVHTPALIIHRKDFLWPPIEHGRYLAEHLPDARLLVLPGDDASDHLLPDEALREIETFVTGASARSETNDRVLATVLFTDMVLSTEHAAALGDSRWRTLMDSHDAITRELVEQYEGRLIKQTGDGILATFDGPGRAIRCADSLRSALRTLAIEIRSGIHTGEIERRQDDITGIGVNVAARVMQHAQRGEILVSGAVPLLMAGSGVDFENRGEWALKGIPGEWPIFAVKT
jgi:class 3 adenylate cyclase